MDQPFIQYLEAKKSVDDRALNRGVWQSLVSHLPAASRERPLRVLEAGCGIGTMLERLLEWGLAPHLDYSGFDYDPANIARAAERFPDWAGRQGYQVAWLGDTGSPGWRLERQPPERQSPACLSAVARLEIADLFDRVRSPGDSPGWDLVVAHAFLDLVDLSTALPLLFDQLEPGGHFYFTLNFDGVTVLEPAGEDPAFDTLVERLYHQTMDERLARGRRSGDSRTGRHLFAQLLDAGAQLLAAGASDWVVFPGVQGYTQEEALFLHSILDTIELALRGRPELDAGQFAAWISERHAQVEGSELVYIAHQLDFAGVWPGRAG